MAPQAFATAGLAAPTARVVPKKSTRGGAQGWPFGRKVGLWLEDNRLAGRSPSTVTALARDVGVSQPAMRLYVMGDRTPKADVAQRVAELMRCSVEYLLDPGQPYPPPDPASSFEMAVGFIPPEEREALRRILADPVERRAWIASWRARQGAR